MRVAALVSFAWFLLVSASNSNAQQNVTETFMVPGADPGIQLYVRNKYRQGTETFPAERVLLFVHGATVPSEPVFDIDLPGGSWMDLLAANGYDAYLVDVRGYGGSTRPAAMNGPPADNPPVAQNAEAVRDVGSAVDFILKRRGIAKLNLVGWSWGTSIMAGYTANHNDKVHKLVLYAPLWFMKSPPAFTGSGAYRKASRDPVRSRVTLGIPPERIEEISPTSQFDKWWQRVLASDPDGAKQTPPAIRAPNGVLKELVEYWGVGKATWEPDKIRVPTLLILAEWDQETPLHMAQEISEKLINAPLKRLVVIKAGTHFVVIEKNRMQLINGVQSFLDE